MGKYTREELKAMAEEFLAAEKQGDFRCIQLTLSVAMLTGMHPEEVRARIVGFAGIDAIA